MIAEFRTSKHLSLRDVAEKMGCSHTAVDKLEKSKNPGVLTLMRYSHAIEVPLTQLVAVYEKTATISLQNA